MLSSKNCQPEAFVPASSASSRGRRPESHRSVPPPRGIASLKYLATSPGPHHAPARCNGRRLLSRLLAGNKAASRVWSLERRRQRGPLGVALRICSCHPAVPQNEPPADTMVLVAV